MLLWACIFTYALGQFLLFFRTHLYFTTNNLKNLAFCVLCTYSCVLCIFNSLSIFFSLFCYCLFTIYQYFVRVSVLFCEILFYYVEVFTDILSELYICHFDTFSDTFANFTIDTLLLDLPFCSLYVCKLFFLALLFLCFLNKQKWNSLLLQTF